MNSTKKSEAPVKMAIAIPCVYKKTFDFHEGLARVKMNDTVSIVDNTGFELAVLSDKYEKIDAFKEGFAGVMNGGKWGYIDMEGREVIPCQYVSTMHFQEGRAQVNENDT